MNRIFSNYLKLAVGLIFALSTDLVLAVSNNSSASTVSAFQTLETQVNSLSTNTTSPIFIAAGVLFSAFAFIHFWKVMAGFILGGVQTYEIILAIVTFFITLLMLSFYNVLTSAVWGLSNYIGGGVQDFFLGNSDPLFAIEHVKVSISKLSFSDVSIWDGVNKIFWLILMTLALVIVEVVVYLAAMWGNWGYLISKAIGYLFIPFYLLEVTRPFFDGWVKLFVGFVVFNMLVKLGVSLYIVFFDILIQTPTNIVAIDPSFGDDQGRSVFIAALVGIFTIIASAGFASLIVGGFTGISQPLGSLGRVIAAKISR